jgi:hypothetical protein
MAREGVERATERVAVLMTPTEKAAYADRASSLGLSLGQFFREAGASYVSRSNARDEEEVLEAALKQLEWSTRRAEPGDVVVRIDPRYFRPAEVETLLDSHHHPRRTRGRDGGRRPGRREERGLPETQGLPGGGIDGEPTHQP